MSLQSFRVELFRFATFQFACKTIPFLVFMFTLQQHHVAGSVCVWGEG